MAKKPEDTPIEPLNIDAALAKKPRNRIARIGVELEGGWRSVPDSARLEADTSVFKDPLTGHQVVPPGIVAGELPLGPMQPAYLTRAMTKYYPQLVDATCGLHVHMSLETLYQYNLLADSPAYQETVIEYLKRWGVEERLPDAHPLFSRLRGESTYCQKKFWPQEQMEAKRKDHDREREGHRYTIIHYCWGRYKTVECRVMPMMDTAAQGTRAVKRLLDITNAYLLTVDRVRVKDRGKVILDSGDIYEERTEIKL